MSELFFSNDLCSAFTFAIIENFTNKFPNGFLGRTAVQKLAYFSQVLGVPIPCSFEIYNYGPYSDDIKFAVDSLLADDQIYDQSPKPSSYSNYKSIPCPGRFSDEISDVVEHNRHRIQQVVDVFGQFRPEKLELIATLHFVSERLSRERKRTVEEEVIQEFLKIKGDKFDQKEVSEWFKALTKGGLVQAQH